MGAVYRLLGSEGVVLYVGSTTRENVARRWVEHFRSQPWSAEIRGCEIVLSDVPSETLIEVERATAQAENPRYGNWSSAGHESNFTSPPWPRWSDAKERAALLAAKSAPGHQIDPNGLKRAMEMVGITPRQLATALDVSLDYVRCIRAGSRRLKRNPVMRHRIADVCGVPIHWIEA